MRILAATAVNQCYQQCYQHIRGRSGVMGEAAKVKQYSLSMPSLSWKKDTDAHAVQLKS